MMVVTILMGGLFLVGTAVAGLLMLYQLKQSSDAVSSGAAVFAADAGTEASLFCYYTTSTPSTICGIGYLCPTSVKLPNGASASSTLLFHCDGGSPSYFTAVSYGYAGTSERVVQSNFSLE